MVMNERTITEEALNELLRITDDHQKAYELFVQIRLKYRCAFVEFRHVKAYECEVLKSYRGAKDEPNFKRPNRTI